MTTKIRLLPYPQRLILSGGTLELPVCGAILLGAAHTADLFFSGRQLQRTLTAVTHATWDLISGGDATLTLRLGDSVGRNEGYRLIISEAGITIEGQDQAGVYYGVMTLNQLLRLYGRSIPQMVIEDWPDMGTRGVMYDISRDNVPTMDTLFALIDQLASWKVNQFQFYSEHVFAYQKHRAVWQNASPITAEEVLILDAYCRERFIEFVPNQTSFGHMNRWFEHEAYLPMAETAPGEFSYWYFPMQTPICLSPAIPETLTFLSGLFAELLPNFTSTKFNVNLDETFDLGMGRTKALVEAKGKGRVYLDHLLAIHKIVRGYGRTMQYWGDIITQYPDLIPDLPKEAIAMDWDYDVDGRFPQDTKLFADAGIPYYVCPGTSAWWSILGRADNCIGNIKEAAEFGLKNGALGMLNTDWGDTAGYRHYLPVSYLGFVCGAAYSWSLRANADANLPALLDTHVFYDESGVMGQLAIDLGNAYQYTGILSRDGSILYSLYARPLAELRAGMPQGRLRHPDSAGVLADDRRLTEHLQQTIDFIEGAISRLGSARMTIDNAGLVTREFAAMARMAVNGAKHGLRQLDPTAGSRESFVAEHQALKAEYPGLWLARSRIGGMQDSLDRIETQHKRFMDAVFG